MNDPHAPVQDEQLGFVFRLTLQNLFRQPGFHRARALGHAGLALDQYPDLGANADQQKCRRDRKVNDVADISQLNFHAEESLHSDDEYSQFPGCGWQTYFIRTTIRSRRFLMTRAILCSVTKNKETKKGRQAQ